MKTEQIAEFQDNANNLMYMANNEDMSCYIAEEIREVIDEAREIIKELLIENRIK